MEGVAVQPHIHLSKEQCRNVAIVVGDPDRARQLAELCDEHKALSWNREYRSFDCKMAGTHFTVISHGVGASGATVCFEELIYNGVKVIIRAGTCGSLAPNKYKQGDLVACYAAAHEDGTSALLAPAGYPAVADPDVYQTLVATAQDLKFPIVGGTALTSDLFYKSPVQQSSLEIFAKSNISVVEMELAPLFMLARLRNIKAGGICCIDGSPFGWKSGDYDPNGEATAEGKIRMIKVAIQAAARFAKQFDS